ncbi:MAG: helix-turn-helix transcriptional regulator [Proteobacteria bacterium]|nr:helix-turn-helix transcriptional regulator [Pseudomonadota bacterium]
MEVIDVRALGKAIRQHRKSIGLTQQDAAGLCGVGERFLSELERGKESASLGKAFQVIKRLGLRLILTDQHHVVKNVNDCT